MSTFYVAMVTIDKQLGLCLDKYETSPIAATPEQCVWPRRVGDERVQYCRCVSWGNTGNHMCFVTCTNYVCSTINYGWFTTNHSWVTS